MLFLLEMDKIIYYNIMHSEFRKLHYEKERI